MRRTCKRKLPEQKMIPSNSMIDDFLFIEAELCSICSITILPKLTSFSADKAYF
jgi:hypothetical protein